jgi:hypothetical protein
LALSAKRRMDGPPVGRGAEEPGQPRNARNDGLARA